MKTHQIIVILFAAAMGSMMLMAATSPPEVMQEKSATTITGTVVDSVSQEGIPEAEVAIEDSEKTATTDEYGTFSIEELEKGTYTLSVEAEGYKSASEEVEVKESGATVEIQLTSEDS